MANNKVTVAILVEAYLMANLRLINPKDPDREKLIAARKILGSIIKNCDHQIEVSPEQYNDIAIVLPTP